MRIKGLSKAFKSPSHSKFWKAMDFTGLGRQLNKARRHAGLTTGRLKRLLSAGALSGTGSQVNSAGAVIPSHVGRSVTEMY